MLPFDAHHAQGGVSPLHMPVFSRLTKMLVEIICFQRYINMLRPSAALFAALVFFCCGHIALAQTARQPQPDTQAPTPLEKEAGQVFPSMAYHYLPMLANANTNWGYTQGDYLVMPAPMEEVMQRFRQFMPQ